MFALSTRVSAKASRTAAVRTLIRDGSGRDRRSVIGWIVPQNPSGLFSRSA